MIEIYDTTLRDGAQTPDVSLKLDDKLRILEFFEKTRIVHCVEGGFPASNPTDKRFFEEAKKLKLNNVKVFAFGKTAKNKEELSALVEAPTDYVTIVGKSWDRHVIEDLGISLEENLKLIENSVSYLKKYKKRVIFDAEHFFEGFDSNCDYTLEVLLAAYRAGANTLVLCDTNGGALCVGNDVRIIDSWLRRRKVDARLGVHMHNDRGLALANTIAAVENGATHVQGTINGLGERCGNADLCQIIPILGTKAKAELCNASMLVDEITNITDPRRPITGKYAFAHKGGIHIGAVLKNPELYEYANPEQFGNRRRILLSDQSGLAAVNYFLKQYNYSVDKEQAKSVLNILKEKEAEGYQYEGAEASFIVLMQKNIFGYKSLFELVEGKINSVISDANGTTSEAVLEMIVDSRKMVEADRGKGPVDAMYRAFMKCIGEKIKEKPVIKDYKVRDMTPQKGSAAKVRVVIELDNKKESWSAVGVSDNIIKASWLALRDGIDYLMIKGI